MPPQMTHLMRAYERLRRRKASSSSIVPIEWPDIDAFVRHTRLALSPREIEIIEDLDDIFLSAMNKAMQASE